MQVSPDISYSILDVEGEPVLSLPQTPWPWKTCGKAIRCAGIMRTDFREVQQTAAGPQGPQESRPPAGRGPGIHYGLCARGS